MQIGIIEKDDVRLVPDVTAAGFFRFATCLLRD
jgi:hypothetical protein